MNKIQLHCFSIVSLYYFDKSSALLSFHPRYFHLRDLFVLIEEFSQRNLLALYNLIEACAVVACVNRFEVRCNTYRLISCSRVPVGALHTDYSLKNKLTGMFPYLLCKSLPQKNSSCKILQNEILPPFIKGKFLD